MRHLRNNPSHKPWQNHPRIYSGSTSTTITPFTPSQCCDQAVAAAAGTRRWIILAWYQHSTPKLSGTGNSHRDCYTEPQFKKRDAGTLSCRLKIPSIVCWLRFHSAKQQFSYLMGHLLSRFYSAVCELINQTHVNTVNSIMQAN